jgi:hypothetical protein
LQCSAWCRQLSSEVSGFAASVLALSSICFFLSSLQRAKPTKQITELSSAQLPDDGKQQLVCYRPLDGWQNCALVMRHPVNQHHRTVERARFYQLTLSTTRPAVTAKENNSSPEKAW